MSIGRWLSVHLFAAAVGGALGGLLKNSSYGWFLDQAPLLGVIIGMLVAGTYNVAKAAFHRFRGGRRSSWVEAFAELFVFCPGGLLLAYLLFGPGATCLWNPLVNTRISSTETPRKFDLLRPGMSADEVRVAVGPPLATDGDLWRYSWGGKCDPIDRHNECPWAWLFLAIRFRDGQLHDVTRVWARD